MLEQKSSTVAHLQTVKTKERKEKERWYEKKTPSAGGFGERPALKASQDDDEEEEEKEEEEDYKYLNFIRVTSLTGQIGPRPLWSPSNHIAFLVQLMCWN